MGSFKPLMNLARSSEREDEDAGLIGLKSAMPCGAAGNCSAYFMTFWRTVHHRKIAVVYRLEIHIIHTRDYQLKTGRVETAYADSGEMVGSKSLKFATVDVFTSSAFQGNQLAIVSLPGNINLDQDTKQRIAREFNFSETVFIHDPTSDNEDRRVDIFTLIEELPFAGHPVIGTLCHLCQVTDPPLRKVNLSLKAGTLVGRYDPETRLAEAEIPHDVRLHQARASRDILDCHLDTQPAGNQWPNGFPVVSVVKGMTFVLVAMPDLAALSSLDPLNQKGLHEQDKLDEGWQSSFMAPYYYTITEQTPSLTRIRSRMMEPTVGEDPCTGSAASTLAAYLALENGQPGRTYAYSIEQGVEMGRAGEIHVKVTLGQSSGIEKLVLAGSAVLMTQGILYLP